MAEQNVDLHCRGQENERLTEKLRQCENLAKEQERKIGELNNALTVAKSQLEQASNQVASLCQKVDDLEHREDLSGKTLDKYEKSFKEMQESIIELKFRACEKEHQCEQLGGENANLSRLVQEKSGELKQLGEKCQRLNEDLDKMGFDLAKAEGSLSQAEATCKLHFAKLAQKIEDVSWWGGGAFLSMSCYDLLIGIDCIPGCGACDWKGLK